MYMTVSVAQMQCLAGKDHFNLRVHICHRQEGCPGLPSQGSINTACDDHLKKKKKCFIVYIAPYSHGFIIMWMRSRSNSSSHPNSIKYDEFN